MMGILLQAVGGDGDDCGGCNYDDVAAAKNGDAGDDVGMRRLRRRRRRGKRKRKK